ncbi:MAG: type I-C CRISPR-associated protein Cas8c/Csd1 [Bryobacterales bacterium]|nr:type I-C CRISPR-associated protein Cas8c/Csd1 [Bryobacterales bacterium]
MSWIQRLYETYENCAAAPQFAKDPPMPVGHTKQQAHIEIVLDGEGNFLRASVVGKEETLVPATEESAGRTRKAVPHPLCDKIQYCAKDYPEYGGLKDSGYLDYYKQLKEWVSGDPHSKTVPVLAYVSKGTVVRDLVAAQVLHVGSDGRLLTAWPDGTAAPEIFRVLAPDAGTKQRDQGSAFVRWRVQTAGDATSGVWDDAGLRDSWTRHIDGRGAKTGLCLVTGEVSRVAVNHPKRLRHSGDGAKLLSSNDEAGYTFRGRFENSEQAYAVGSIVSQKAHNALRWLIARQGSKSGDQVYVAWAAGGGPVPDPLKNSADLFALVMPEEETQDPRVYAGDAGQHFSLRLKAAIAGYGAELAATERVAILGLNSATPGRMAITYYRELLGHEFLDRIANWHNTTAWHQDYGKDRKFTGAPSPRDIAEVSFGRRVDESLRVATVERLLPCIIDGRSLPRDLVLMAYRRVCNRQGAEEWEWKKALGVACALHRSLERGENYQMSLEVERRSRDYLYGRLLAIAENIEERALHVAGEKRDTSAAKLMQRYSVRPCSTWRTIALALKPSESRLRARRPSVLLERQKLLDQVMEMFRPEEFVDDSALSGEFLLGYHCQRAALWGRGKEESGEGDEGAGKKNGADE